MELKEFHELFKIWNNRNPIATRFTFQPKHCTGFTQCRIDFIFHSNGLQEFVSNTNDLTALYTGHYQFILHSQRKKTTKGNDLGTEQLFEDDMYVSEIKQLKKQQNPIF